MPRGDATTSNCRKRAARELAAQQAIPYTAALRQLGQQPTPPIPPEARAAIDVDPAAGYADTDISHEARAARQDAENLRYWKHRRAGRPVRLWNAEIEVRCAATSEDEAWWRIALGYMRRPLHRVPGLQSYTINLPENDPNNTHDIERVPDADVDPTERRRLEDDYPRRRAPWPAEWSSRGPEKTFDIGRYVLALRRGGARAGDLFPLGVLPDPEPLSDDVRLGIWRAGHSVQFLAGLDIADARRRADEFAATIVDAAGHPLGRVIDVQPDDGFRNAQTGQWIHPAAWGGTGNLEALWDDYDAEGRPGASLSRVLLDEADRLERQWAQENDDIAAHDARLHTQPDGTRTLSTPAELAQAGYAAKVRHGGKPTAELRAEADHYDYMADRVYGKVVNDDDDIKRIEQAVAQAKALRELADDLDTRAARHRTLPYTEPGLSVPSAEHDHVWSVNADGDRECDCGNFRGVDEA